jgi:hypothetical protein
VTDATVQSRALRLCLFAKRWQRMRTGLENVGSGGLAGEKSAGWEFRVFVSATHFAQENGICQQRSPAA